jgi:hypothetical protein
MHEGDPRAQIRPEARGDGACVDCHEALARDDALEAHTHHPASSEGSRCAGCHMPRIVYGLVDVLRSHRIEIPDPARDKEAARPDACTLCHVDETRAWAVREAARLWPRDERTRVEPALGSAAGETDSPSLPESLRVLFGGDPIERSVAAKSLARTAGPAREDQHPTRLAALLDVMEHDPYPAVRRIAWRAARALAPEDERIDRYDPMAFTSERARTVAEIRAALPAGSLADLDAPTLEGLRARAREVAIEIGE